jgi:hypothetical protein
MQAIYGSRILRLRRTILLLFLKGEFETGCFDSFLLIWLFNRRGAPVEELSNPQ